ncbi:MAG: GTP-binding protein [Bacillota bacterium]|nr:GTP-binding protein [Bacillota bacterium]
MVKVDLITGFLGSGKTTFIRKYVKYLLSKGEKICILENDYGAINVDMMLLSDLKSERLGLEMVAGGCDHESHRRRFKTKLITMAMLGYNRVIIEPSGIFDVDEFFDILHEDPLYDRYEISNVLVIVDANLETELSNDARYLLASQCATAGRIILSRTQEVSEEKISTTIEHVNAILKEIQCRRQFDLQTNISIKDWSKWTDSDLEEIKNSGYKETSFVKNFSMDRNQFQSLFFMNLDMSKNEILEKMNQLWSDSSVGTIFRIKGFVQEEKQWMEMNATKEGVRICPIEEGQNVLIVIGENLDETKISSYFSCEYSTIHTM